VELTRALGHRIIEFHLKDTKPEHRGGAKQRLERNDPMKDPIFFELGKGGVDFPSRKGPTRRPWRSFKKRLTRDLQKTWRGLTATSTSFKRR
jgi:sugar phosphate isomerase/epimerase